MKFLHRFAFIVLIFSALFALTTATAFASGATWTQRTSAGQRDWVDIQLTPDGNTLVAVAYAGAPDTFNPDYIYTSTDGGVTWTQRTGTGAHFWDGIASSTDGTKLIAAAKGPDYIYTSTDGGVTWTQRTSAGQRSWEDVASSADGTKLVALSAHPGASSNPDYIYTSTDGGVTWTQQTGAGLAFWDSVGSSGDGSKLVVDAFCNTLPCVSDNAAIYTSIDGGTTWIQQTNAGYRNWEDITITPDGTKVVAASANDNAGNPDYIYTATLSSTLTTLAASSLGATSATLNGSIGDIGNGTTRGFVYGTTRHMEPPPRNREAS